MDSIRHERSITPTRFKCICCGLSYYMEISYKESSESGGHHMWTYCGNNMDYVKLWMSAIFTVRTRTTTVNPAYHRTYSVQCTISKELSSRGLMSRQALTSPLQNH